MRKYLAGMVMMLLGFALQTSVVEAHTPNVNHNCAGVSWQFSSYEHANATVTVDGVVVASKTNFSNWSGSHPWDQTKAHTYSVIVDDVGTQWDRSWQGTQQNCQQATTSTSSSTTSTTSSSSTTTSTTEASTTTSTVPTSSSSSTSLPETSTTENSTTTTSDVSTTIPSSVLPTTMPGAITTTPTPPEEPPTGFLPETGPSEVRATLGWALIASGAGVLVVLLARRPRNAS